MEIPQNFENRTDKRKYAKTIYCSKCYKRHKSNGRKCLSWQILLLILTSIRDRDITPSKKSSHLLLKLVTSNWFNRFLNYPAFMVPGILVILVTMVGAYMCSVNIVKEKEIGTIEQINVTPIRKHHFILGKLIPFWVIGMFVFSIGLFLVSRIVYGIVPEGSIFVLYSISCDISFGRFRFGINYFNLLEYAATGHVVGLFLYDDFYFDGWIIYLGR